MREKHIFTMVRLQDFLTPPDVTIDNPVQEFNGRFGTSVDGIGDFNHDGFGDIIVGSPRNNSFASIYCGSSEGVTTTPSITLTEVGAFGWSVSHAGDIKGNGQNFIIVGDELGAAFLYALNDDGSGHKKKWKKKRHHGDDDSSGH